MDSIKIEDRVLDMPIGRRDKLEIVCNPFYIRLKQEFMKENNDVEYRMVQVIKVASKDLSHLIDQLILIEREYVTNKVLDKRIKELRLKTII